MPEQKNTNGVSTTLQRITFYLDAAFFRKERNFLILIGLCFFTAGLIYPYRGIAMWFGFAISAYAAMSNDAIQTIGTFISSNSDRPWWALWLHIGIIFLVTVTVSWVINDGDVTYQRLATKGFSQAPQSFQFLQVAAPIFLLIITRLRMPVSTTFLLLSSFTTSPGAIAGVLQKSLSGYFIAFIVAFVLWISLNKLMNNSFRQKAPTHWVVIQWLTSGTLWSLWIMQDAANIAVFLPRSLNLIQFLMFSLTIFMGLGLIFYLRGDKIQGIVEEKTEVKDVRKATIIDLVYAAILVFFTLINTVPMSTTWVFIGLLAGRELAIKVQDRRDRNLDYTWKMVAKDLTNALIGLVLSVVIAIATNELLREEIRRMIPF